MNALALVAVPPAVVTVKLLAPAVPAGVLAVIEVALTTTTLVAATPFTFTLVAPVRLVPVIVNEVPAASGPEVGLTVVIVGSEIKDLRAMVCKPPPAIAVTPF